MTASGPTARPPGAEQGPTLRDALMAEVAAFLARSGMTLTTLSRLALGAGYAITRWQEHYYPRAASARRVRAFIAAWGPDGDPQALRLIRPLPADAPLALDLLTRAAVAGDPCPSNRAMAATLGISDARLAYLVSMLALHQHIAVDSAGHRRRRIRILTGPHAGAATAPSRVTNGQQAPSADNPAVAAAMAQARADMLARDAALAARRRDEEEDRRQRQCRADMADRAALSRPRRGLRAGGMDEAAQRRFEQAAAERAYADAAFSQAAGRGGRMASDARGREQQR